MATILRITPTGKIPPLPIERPRHYPHARAYLYTAYHRYGHFEEEVGLWVQWREATTGP